LYSTDFRASETLFQQILQVAGRAGRRDKVGDVYIQTAFVDHPFFRFVRTHDFHGFAASLLEERASAGFPPKGHFAVIRAESTHQAKALQFLRIVHGVIKPLTGVKKMDAVPAPMERRAGRYRAQLLISASTRSALHGTLEQWLEKMDSDTKLKKLAASVRWSLDIYPIDLF
jgi:primosomal protein N' (replication factor Y)